MCIFEIIADLGKHPVYAIGICIVNETGLHFVRFRTESISNELRTEGRAADTDA